MGCYDREMTEENHNTQVGDRAYEKKRQEGIAAS